MIQPPYPHILSVGEDWSIMCAITITTMRGGNMYGCNRRPDKLMMHELSSSSAAHYCTQCGSCHVIFAAVWWTYSSLSELLWSMAYRVETAACYHGVGMKRQGDLEGLVKVFKGWELRWHWTPGCFWHLDPDACESPSKAYLWWLASTWGPLLMNKAVQILHLWSPAEARNHISAGWVNIISPRSASSTNWSAL